MTALLSRPVDYVKTLRRASHFAIPFVRRAWFRMPEKIEIGGASYAISCPDEHGCQVDFISVFLDDAYRLSEIARRFGAAGTVADIGANVGWFSLAARAFFPAAEIHSYEPNPIPAATLKKNTRQLDRFHFYPEAVGGTEGMVDIVHNGESNLGVSVPGRSVRQVSLREVVRRCGGQVDVLKLDCEGAEWSMFADPAPWQGIATVTMEYHLGDRHADRDAADALRGLGFEILEHRPSVGCGMLLAHRARPS